MAANDKQVGGDHYKKAGATGEEHWDRQYRLFGPGYFVGCATKYIERYRDKNGKQDLEKAIHFVEKLIELEYPANPAMPVARTAAEVAGIIALENQMDAEAGGAYVNQDPDVHRLLVKADEGRLANADQVRQYDAFIYEGGSTTEDFYRCKTCREHLTVPLRTNPHARHSCAAAKGEGISLI